MLVMMLMSPEIVITDEMYCSAVDLKTSSSGVAKSFAMDIPQI